MINFLEIFFRVPLSKYSSTSDLLHTCNAHNQVMKCYKIKMIKYETHALCRPQCMASKDVLKIIIIIIIIIIMFNKL